MVFFSSFLCLMKIWNSIKECVRLMCVPWHCLCFNGWSAGVTKRILWIEWIWCLRTWYTCGMARIFIYFYLIKSQWWYPVNIFLASFLIGWHNQMVVGARSNCLCVMSRLQFKRVFAIEVMKIRVIIKLVGSVFLGGHVYLTPTLK